MTSRRPLNDEELSAFLDGELDGKNRAEVAERLLLDADARRRLDRDRKVAESLRSDFECVDDDLGRFQSEIDALARTLSKPRRGRAVWQQMAAGVVLFAAGWSAHVGYGLYSSWRVPEVVQEAAQAHQVFAHNPVRPVETSNATLLKRWFSSHLGEEVAIPDLRSVGLRFIGGRLLSSEHGPLAQMIYEDPRGRRLSLYVSADDDTGGTEIEIVRFDAVDAGYWRDGDVVYTIVAESSVEQVIAVASAFGIVPRADGNEQGN